MSGVGSTEPHRRRLDEAGGGAEAPASPEPKREESGGADSVGPGAGSGAAAEDASRTFEELSRELENIVARLERGDVAVDDAVAFFERGEELHKLCVERLEAAQLRLEDLSTGDGGERA